MSFLHNPIVASAFLGFIVAAAVDLHAWKSWDDAKFNFKTASYRWVTGAIFGALAAAGYKNF